MTRALRLLLDTALLPAALAVIAVVGTGGTTLTVLGARVGLNHLENPLMLLSVAVAARLLMGLPEAGVEGWVRRWATRGGMPPSLRRAGPGTVLRTSLFFAGAGLVGGLVDALQLALRHPDLTPRLADVLPLAVISAGVGVITAWPVGIAVAGAVLWVARLAGEVPTAYALGRRVFAFSLPFNALAVLVSVPEWTDHEVGRQGLPPLTLVPLLTVMVTPLVFLGLPALWMRARQGRWGPMAGAATVLCLVAVLALVDPDRRVPPVSPGGEQRPPLLLITAGSLRADALGAYGGSSDATPHLDALAAQGTLVEQAVAPIPATLPAIITLHAGRSPEVHGYRSARSVYHGPSPTLAAVLRTAGYRTAAFVGDPHLKASRSGLGRGFDFYDDTLGWREAVAGLTSVRTLAAHGLLPGPTGAPGSRPGEQVVDRALSWIGRAGTGGWMAWIHLDDARPPFAALLAGDGRAATPEGDRAELARRLASGMATAAEVRQVYRRGVTTVDRQIGRLMEGLEAAGCREETLVAVTADHGEPLDRGGGLSMASFDLSDVSVVVPLIVAGPGVARGRRIPGQASLAEVAPALATLLAVGVPVSDDPALEWEPTDLPGLVSARSPSPPAGRIGRPVCLEARAVSGPASQRPRAVRWAGLKLIQDPGRPAELLWVGSGGEAPAPRTDERMAERIERMQAELAACALIAREGEDPLD